VEIPFTVSERPDTGLTNPKFGIWLFLASEVMLFGSLFSSYIILRTGSLDWPVQSDELNITIGAINTAILIASSLTMVLSWTALKEKQFKRFKLFIGLTILFAVLFLVLKIWLEYIPKIHHGHILSTNTFFAMYYLMTGLHALHILGGVVVMIFFWGPGSKMWQTNPDQFVNRIEVVGLYWHFVDLVWIFLFPTLYLL
jgi:heme/copper-type cytochrome/quinol oxidase subunit 3